MNYYQLIFRPDFRSKYFYEGRTYIFKSELELKKGDYVVAMTQFGYQIAVIYEKNEVEASPVFGEGVARIVTKLDGNYYEELEKIEKMKEIEKILNKKTKEISKIMQYETLAKYDENAKELLEEYKRIRNDKYVFALPETSTKCDDEEEDLPF